MVDVDNLFRQARCSGRSELLVIRPAHEGSSRQMAATAAVTSSALRNLKAASSAMEAFHSQWRCDCGKRKIFGSKNPRFL